MIHRGKHNVLGVQVDAVDYAAATRTIINSARRHERLAVSALAVHGIMTGALDRAHRYRLNQLDLVCPDGQPVRWALNLLHGAGLSERVYGPQLMLDVCRAAADEGLPVFLFGGTAKMSEALGARLRFELPALEIAGMRPSKFRRLDPAEWQELMAEVRASGARILFIGLGCPRQEIFAFEARDELSIPAIAVGAAFSFHAGTTPQAPEAMQRWGLEWFYRLVREPQRLWRRYLLLNPLYLTLFALQASGLYVIKPAGAQPPQQEMRYG